MRRCGLVVLAALAACGDNGALPVGGDDDGLPPPPPPGSYADFEEGPEPNGLGVIEPSFAPAGIVALKPVTNTLVLHGHVAPFEDADHDGGLDPDVDTWRIHVTAPVLVQIAVEGAGFRIHVPGYERFGVAVAGPAIRALYLPIAGDYDLSIAASQTWIERGAGGDGAYTATIEQRPAPLAPVLGFDAGALAVDASLVYTLLPGDGFNVATFAIDDDRAPPALTFVRGGAIVAATDHARRAELVIHADQTGQPITVIAEPLYSLASGPVPYAYEMRATTARELPRDGDVIALPPTPSYAGDVVALGQLYFDAYGEVEALAFAFDHPVRAAIYGDDLAAPVAEFGGLDAGSPTFTSYTGVIHLPREGRYSLVYDAPGGEPLSVKSATRYSFQPVQLDLSSLDGHFTPELPIIGTLYDAGTTARQLLETADGVTTAFYPATELGRIQPVTTSAGVLPGRTPLWSYTSGWSHLRDYTGEAVRQFLVTATPVGAPTDQRYYLGASDASYIDLGTLGPGGTLARTGQVYASTTPGYAGVHATPGTPIAIAATAGVHVRLLDRLGHPIATDPTTIVQDASGWTAVDIRPVVEEQVTPYTLTFSTP